MWAYGNMSTYDDICWLTGKHFPLISPPIRDFSMINHILTNKTPIDQTLKEICKGWKVCRFPLQKEMYHNQVTGLNAEVKVLRYFQLNLIHTASIVVEQEPDELSCHCLVSSLAKEIRLQVITITSQAR